MRRTVEATHRLAVAALALLALPATAQPPLGEECEPGAAPPRPGLSCQATDEFDYRLSYVANARSGDVLLSAGCGMIGGLLRRVAPPQRYSHSGIMVGNWTRLRHSTAAEERYVEGAGGDGLVPDLLKYGWPGTITVGVDEAYEGRWLIDPEDASRSYFVHSFNGDPASCPDDAAAIYPAVVKPFFEAEDDPLPGGETVRAALERVAAQAEAIRGHYRFFAYSDADIVGRAAGPGGRAPADRWLGGAPDGTVCSQLVWNAAKAARLVVEDAAVEPGDRPHPDAAGKSGLFLYSEDERRAAGEWLYDRIYNQFYEESGWWGRLLTDAPDDGANQVVNCFGFDWCGSEPGMGFDGEEDAKDSDRWRREPGTGLAVSPDDISHWDAPLYGNVEDLVYRPGEYVRVHRWGASAGTGGVAARVTYRGAATAGADVTLLGFPGLETDAAGAARFAAVPSGRYALAATARVLEAGTPVDVQASGTVEVQAGREAAVELALQPPTSGRPETSRAHRRVTVAGTVFIKDHEDWPSSNEEETHSFSEAVVLEPVGKREHTFSFSRCTGDEVRVETSVRVALDPVDGSVQAELAGTLFEGDDCDTDDDEDDGAANVHVARDGSTSTGLHLVNGCWCGDDEARIDVTVTNGPAS